MCPQLGQPAVLDHGDAVGVVRRLEPVRDRDDGAALEDGGQRLLQVTGRARIEQRGRLVEHERVRVGEHEPCERDLLLLRRRQWVTARADDGLEPERQHLEPRPRIDGLERGPELIVGRLHPGQPEVVRDRADEDVLFLRHERHLLPQRLQLEVHEADVAHLDAAGARRMDPRKQPAERGLAGAGRPDDGDPLARLEIEVEAVEHVAILDVGVADVRGTQPLVLRLLAGGGAVVGNLRHADEPGERRCADLDLVEPGDEAVDGIGELLHVERDRRHLADRRMAGGDEPAAPHQRHRDGQHVRDLDRREEDRAEIERPPLGPVGVVPDRRRPDRHACGRGRARPRCGRRRRFPRRCRSSSRTRRAPRGSPPARGAGTSASRSGSPAPRRCTTAP